MTTAKLITLGALGWGILGFVAFYFTAEKLARKRRKLFYLLAPIYGPIIWLAVFCAAIVGVTQYLQRRAALRAKIDAAIQEFSVRRKEERWDDNIYP